MKIKNTISLVALLFICLQGFSQQKIYICTSNERIYTLELTNCSSQLIGPSGADLYDIAVTPDGKLWGISLAGYFYNIDTVNGAATFIGVVGFTGNGLVELNDSTLLMSGGGNLYRINVFTGAATFIGVTGFVSEGDLTWYDNDLYLIAAGGFIIKIQLNNTNTAIISATPINNGSNLIPDYCWGAFTAQFPFETNYIMAIKRTGIVYKICPFNVSIPIICPLINGDDVLGAASIRLPLQNPIPTNCGPVATINELAASRDFDIYPNPANNEIKIRNLELKKYEVAIYDLTGKKIFQSIIDNQQSNIDISKLNKGVYFLQIKTTDFIHSGKLVIAR